MNPVNPERPPQDRLRELEDSLLRASRAGRDGAAHEADFSEYVALRQKHLHRLAHKITNDHHAAQDAVQEAYAALHERLFLKRGSSDDLASVGAWLTRVVMHDAMDQRRRAERRETVPLDAVKDSDMAKDEDSRLERTEMLEEAWARIDALSPQQRKVFLLHTWHGLSHRDIARRLGITPQAAERCYYRARAQARSSGTPSVREA